MLDKLVGRGRHAKRNTKRSRSRAKRKAAPAQRGWHHFTWENDGRAGLQIEEMLALYGVPCQARHLPTSDGVSVPMARAREAEYYLLCAGVPLTSELIDPRNEQWAAARNGSMPPPRGDGLSAKRIDFVGRLARVADAIIGGSANRRAAVGFVNSRKRSTKQRRI